MHYNFTFAGKRAHASPDKIIPRPLVKLFTKEKLLSLTKEANAIDSRNQKFLRLLDGRKFELVDTGNLPRLLFRDLNAPSNYYNIWINGKASYGPKTLADASSKETLNRNLAKEQINEMCKQLVQNTSE